MKDTDGLVVSAETVDSGFDQDESELGVLVLAVALEMLAHGDGLYPQFVNYRSNLGIKQVPRMLGEICGDVHTFLINM